MNTKKTGDYGERLARRYLWLHGYFVKEKNYRTRHGEIDIIAKKGKYTVFVEVKTRQEQYTKKYGNPRAAVNYEKRQHIRYAVNDYLRRKNLKTAPRIDIIEVYLTPEGKKSRINHIISAFGAKG